MSKHKPPRQLPVSQRELANYLGISQSLLNMASGRSLSRSLPAGLTEKLLELGQSHETSKKSKKLQKPLVKTDSEVAREASVLADQMLMDAEYYQARAKVLQGKLDAMINREQEDMQWLNTIEQKLSAFAANKEPGGDHLWFGNQQALVFERLKRSGITAQVKLQMEIELAKARAAINRELLKKLKNQYKPKR